MRPAFVRALVAAAERDERIVLLVGDLGFGAVEPFAQRFPDRFVNMGVAEQNMTSVAAGMALSGKVVFTYTIANFATLRCLEQIRNDVCYHKANVKIVAVGAGFAYGSLGMSHHATEDLAIMRALPEMTVVAPGDPLEAEAATHAVAERSGPCYLRLGRAGEPLVHRGPVDFCVGKAITVREGDYVTLIALGTMLPLAVTVADTLNREGLSTRVLSMHTVKPLDTEAIALAVRETKVVATLEEHSIIGGLGGAVAEFVAELPKSRAKFIRLGLPSAFVTVAGSRDYLLGTVGLSETRLAEVLRNLASGRRGAGKLVGLGRSGLDSIGGSGTLPGVDPGPRPSDERD